MVSGDWIHFSYEQSSEYENSPVSISKKIDRKTTEMKWIPTAEFFGNYFMIFAISSFIINMLVIQRLTA